MKEEIHWKKKLEIKWLQEGDRNTRLFHQSNLEYKRRKIIMKSIDTNINTWEDEE